MTVMPRRTRWPIQGPYRAGSIATQPCRKITTGPGAPDEPAGRKIDDRLRAVAEVAALGAVGHVALGRRRA